MLGDGDFRDCTDPSFLNIIDRVRAADCAVGHLETLLHDFASEELYPAVEAGWVWMQSPSEAADCLPWMGFDAVTLASNHSLDYSYGGLRSTWRALDRVGIPHAGTGRSLEEAQRPLVVGASSGVRVGVLSMASSFAPWARAGAAHGRVPARPGLNPLRHSHVVQPEELGELRQLWGNLGLWVNQVSDREWWVNPPGLHNSLTRYILAAPGSDTSSIVDPVDSARQLEAIKSARLDCDVVVAHVHVHEWDPRRGLSYPPDFIVSFAHDAVDAGAQVVFAQGSHAPVRGLERYHDGIIIYDSGDFVLRSGSISLHPADFYDRHRHAIALREATNDGSAERAALGYYSQPSNPAGGYYSANIGGATLVECVFSEKSRLQEVRLHPFNYGATEAVAGLPLEATGESATKILRHLAMLSASHGCEMVVNDNVGVIAF